MTNRLNIPVVREGLQHLHHALTMIRREGPRPLAGKVPPGMFGPRYGGICLQVDIFADVMDRRGNHHAFMAKSAMRDFDDVMYEAWEKFSGDHAYPIPVPKEQILVTTDCIVRQKLDRDPRFTSRIFYEHFDRRLEGWSPHHWYGALRLELLDHMIEYLAYLGVE